MGLSWFLQYIFCNETDEIVGGSGGKQPEASHYSVRLIDEEMTVIIIVTVIR